MTKEYKILMVEDEPDLAEIFSAGLRNAGFKVEVVTDGKMALAKIKQEKFDLVLLDLVIPELDGYAVLEQIKKAKDTKQILIQVWSNLTQKGEIERAKKLGANGYLIKSDYTPTKLAEKVKEILGIGK